MNKKDIHAIQEAIKSDDLNWTAKENFLTKLSNEEQKKYLGYTPGPGEPSLEEREKMSVENYKAFLSSSVKAEAYRAPSSIDWRSKDGKNYVTGVKNQGGCGSCVAFGTLAAVESKLKIQRGHDTDIDLSEAHLFYCIARSQGRRCGGSSGGWWPEPAMVACRDEGVTDEHCYTYTAGDQNCTGLSSSYSDHITKITGYKKLTSINAIKEWIADEGPVQACFTVYNDFYAYNSGVYRKSSGADRVGGHCVCLIGYDDSQQCWIAKNSWGSGWGDNGYFRIGYGQCGIDSDEYGVEGILETRWIKGKKVVGMWANESERNAWAYLSDTGWKKISNANDDGFINSVSQLASAKTNNSNVNVYLDKDEITTLYVF